MPTSKNYPLDARVTIRVDKELKESAELLFDRLGMNMSTAFNVFLRKAVDEEAIPFTISVKNSPAQVASQRSNMSAAECSNTTPSADSELAPQNSQAEPPASKINSAPEALPDATREYVNRYGKPL
ncbi:MAG: type II toxin-antitoxin system RelB/DinJ family antitoxin [Dehalococcoidia bacterium]|nr:type II toxin-antitoxin system RelB/DinJ family antitoxin [Dehalococcoidia bacterium]